ncbi:MHS family MFS transporter [Mycolicibacterium flavescens]|uniref:MFS transporter n=1 Tax=Mycolicibacterium flavescens TaxID=1776 RepID=UPI000D6D7E41|nr:MFS transporter [Mycolicibacterium flavescens]MCV7278908.1 MHS family MFS transporter [Mycolicibacterium flavescens]
MSHTRQHDRSSLRRIAVSSLIGTAIEYYDFLIYASLAALVFGKVFFPNSDPAVATIASFGTFAAGYLARPIGGVLFGHFGDRVGRKSMLVLTMTLMGISSFLIGLLPGYAQIGVAAPVLLVALRVVQGVALGGEWGGATLMVAEHADPDRRGFWNGLMQMGSPVGSLLATLVVTMVTWLPEDAMLDWGWRVPYLLSAALLAAGLYIRLHVPETPAFERMAGQRRRLPFAEVLRRPARFLLAWAVGIGPFALTALLSTYMISYATAIGYETSTVMTGVLFVSLTALVAIPVFSALSDRVGRRTVVFAGALGIVIFAWPMYTMVDSGSVTMLFVALTVGQVLQSAMYAPLGALLSEMFGTTVRYTGVSMGYQFAALVGGGFTPLFASVLLAADVRSAPLVVLAACCGAVTILAIAGIRETKGLDITTLDGRPI